jgi:hypothetical protein
VIDTSGRPDGLRETLREDAANLTGEWAFEVQLLRNMDKQPVEDASVEWPEDVSPFVQVGTLRIEPQDSWSADKVQRIDETLHFSPWNALAAHRRSAASTAPPPRPSPLRRFPRGDAAEAARWPMPRRQRVIRS